MPALLVDTSTTTTRPASSSNASTASDHSPNRHGSGSPDRPPVSPITPTVTVAQLAPIDRPEARPRPAPPPAAAFIEQPPSVAIAESENPDAIALRSAISLLQLQREKSKRDLQALEELKAAAVSDPHGFVRSLQEQRAHTTDRDPRPAQHSEDVRKDSASMDTSPAPSQLPTIPQPQNIVRCPPINWAKYHVVGEPLDRMHEEQKRWPGSAEPPRLQSGIRAPPHSVAAPYSPFTDGIAKSPSPSQPPKASKKSPSPSQPSKASKKSPSRS